MRNGHREPSVSSAPLSSRRRFRSGAPFFSLGTNEFVGQSRHLRRHVLPFDPAGCQKDRNSLECITTRGFAVVSNESASGVGWLSFSLCCSVSQLCHFSPRRDAAMQSAGHGAQVRAVIGNTRFFLLTMAPALELSGITKSFGDFRARRREPERDFGEVHALLVKTAPANRR